MISSRTQGRFAEIKAERYLKKKGMVTVCRNYAIKANGQGGEIDLIMRHATILVFVEVRSRTQGLLGLAQETINLKKRHFICQAATHFLQHHPKEFGYCRFDVVAIQMRPDQITWIPNAFEVPAF